MAETVIQLAEALKKGLRNREQDKKGLDNLVTCTFLKPGDFGLEPFVTPTQPVSGAELTANSITVGTSGPQYFKGKSRSFVLEATKLWELDEDAGTLTQITTYDFVDQVSTKSIPSGELWQASDNNDFWCFWNGQCLLTLKPYSTGERAFVNDTNTINTGCLWKGRTFFGGFDPSDYYSTQWETEWESKYSQLIAWDSRFGLGGPAENWVWWSSIGGGDTFLSQGGALDVTSSSDGISGLPSGTQVEDDELYTFYSLRNEAGFMPMPWQGKPTTIKPLGRYVIVYGENGVSALNPIVNPVPTMGLVPDVLNIGVPFRGLVCGNEQMHYFVTNQGVLYKINAELQVERLGYEEFLLPMVGSYDKQQMAFDPNRGDVFISDSSFAYMYNPAFGLAKAPFALLSGVQAEGAFLAFTHSTDSGNPSVVSKDITVGRNQLTTLRRVDVVLSHGASDVDITLKIESKDTVDTATYRVEYNGALSEFAYNTNWITASHFKITLTPDRQDCIIEDVVLTFDDEGKKDLRKLF